MKRGKRARDIQKGYTNREFVAKLRRLADAIERDRPFAIQIAGERIHVPAQAVFNIEHERSREAEEIESRIQRSRR